MAKTIVASSQLSDKESCFYFILSRNTSVSTGSIQCKQGDPPWFWNAGRTLPKNLNSGYTTRTRKCPPVTHSKKKTRRLQFLLGLLVTGRNEVVAKVMFLLVSVILLTVGGVCLSACWDTTPPLGSRHPPREADPTPEADTPTPPEADTPPGIRSMSGRYASYWNAFLFYEELSLQPLFRRCTDCLSLGNLTLEWH